ncbi:MULTISPECIES: hypothetical protein [Alphaproteobacteria]|uniref:hypothetical protein n=1 Tax=Alphaproteobacteria TaxID=28211 RepID=UPI003298DD82
MSAQTLAWRRKRAFSKAIDRIWDHFNSIDLRFVIAIDHEVRPAPDSPHLQTERAALICEEMATDSTLFLCERNKLLEAARRIREAG